MQIGSGLCIISIATNGYLKYWKELVYSAEKNLGFKKYNLQFFLLTDDSEEAITFASKFNNFEFCIERIESYVWPDATLLRYKLIAERLPRIHKPNLLYLDADMRICDDFIQKFSMMDLKQMNFVSHPGFYRDASLIGRVKYYGNIRNILTDSRLLFKVGGIGTWETRTSSAAFVPRRKRKKYACGGIWFGDKKNFSKFIHWARGSVNNDLQKGIVAIWHDESHLNKFVSENNLELRSPVLCFDQKFSSLRNMTPFIMAVDKEYN
jgi:hypothetical protein